MVTNKVVFRCGLILLLCWMCLGAATTARAAVFDSVTWTINHPGGATPNPQNFAKDITKGQAVELQGNAERGTDVVRIISTALLADPNGLIAVSVPGDAKKVVMTTNANAAAQAYALKIGGLYEYQTAPGGNGGYPIAPWAGDANAKVKHNDGDGGIEIGNVVRGVNMPYSVAKNKSCDVQVVFWGNMVGKTVTFSVEESNAANGTASIEGKNTLSGTDTIKVHGDAMTQPGHGGNLVIVGKLNGGEIARSAGFSVCAHPQNIKYKRFKVLKNSMWDIDPERRWGAAYVMEVGDVTSDSGMKDDLANVKIAEVIETTEQSGWFKDVPETQVNKWLPITGGGTIYDLNTIHAPPYLLDSFLSGLKSGKSDSSQYHRFSCPCCGTIEDFRSSPIVEGGCFRITKTLSPDTLPGWWKLHIRHAGETNPLGYSPGTVETADTEMSIIDHSLE